MGNILEIKQMRTTFSTMRGKVDAIRGVDLHVEENEILGIVGESGSGKSVTMKSVMGLLPKSAKVTADVLEYRGEDLSNKTEKQLRAYRGKEMAMIFQDPMTALNPLRTIGYHLIEVIRRYRKVTKAEAAKIAVEMLRQVGIPSPEERMKQYPHEFSGGMRQRVVISMALCCEPSLLIADEPTTALDVTIQGQILDLLKRLKQERGMSVVLISHDMGVMANLCDRIAVMYGGVLVEEGTVDEIFYQPKHPYTRDLLRSIPRPEITRGSRLQSIDGAPPSLFDLPKGCPFATRCQQASQTCFERMPESTVFSETQNAKCHLLTGKE
ncbi:MAG: ABC transporter ATP-binding protein [Oscillospiraceae bacterium]|nr:ABC transporter ATP-binding protein [Oscillospiraceae bacterium]